MYTCHSNGEGLKVSSANEASISSLTFGISGAEDNIRISNIIKYYS